MKEFSGKLDKKDEEEMDNRAEEVRCLKSAQVPVSINRSCREKVKWENHPEKNFLEGYRFPYQMDSSNIELVDEDEPSMLIGGIRPVP